MLDLTDTPEKIADDESVDPRFREDVLRGLRADVRAIPARWFYDHAGSKLFEEITGLEEYYPTRTEISILEGIGRDLAAVVGKHRAVVEFGSGSSTKTPLLLGAISPAAYVPIDISGDFLRESAAALHRHFSDLPIYPLEADFTQPIALPPEVADISKLGFFPGSTIGNLIPARAVDLLRSMRGSLGEGSQLLIGLDRVKPESIVIPAYDDGEGVTAAFNLNLLNRINRELDGNVPVENFRHKIVWNDEMSRIEMHLEASQDCEFDVAGEAFRMTAGETIHTENSHKYDRRDARLLLRAGGWTPVGEWHDENDWFSIFLCEARPSRHAP